jgi:DNA-binding MarR family transcriptional regulator
MPTRNDILEGSRLKLPRRSPGKRASRRQSGDALHTSGTAPNFELERFLPYRLFLAATEVSRAFAKVYSDRFGLGIPEWRIIAMLARLAPLSTKELAEVTGLDKVRVSRSTADLMRNGLVRSTTNHDDRRKIALELTAKGEKLHRSIIPLALRLEDELLSDLSSIERIALYELIAKVLSSAKAYQDKN